MEPSPYERSAFQVTLYDCVQHRPVRSYMLLSAAPDKVVKAARRARFSLRPSDRAPAAGGVRWPQASWDAKDSQILREYYGTHWRILLTPQVSEVMQAAHGGEPDPQDQVQGGADFRTATDILSDFDNLEKIQGGPSTWESTDEHDEASPADDDSPGTQYSATPVYPDDTLGDLRRKIQLATGIPFYRQHLFYFVGDEPRQPYRLELENSILPLDIRLYGREAGAQQVAGVWVNPLLEQRSEDTQVVALDEFTLLDEPGRHTIRQVYLVDLNSLLLSGQVSQALEDPFQRDLIYYGLILPYWPHLSREAFDLAVRAPAQLAQQYPGLWPDTGRLARQVEQSSRLISQALASAPAALRAYHKQGVAITDARIEVGATLQVNVRNVFDRLQLSPSVVAATVRFRSEGDHTGRIYAYSKHYVAATTLQVERFLSRKPPRAFQVTIMLLDGGSHPIYVTLRASGPYLVESVWNEEEQKDHEAVLADLRRRTAELVGMVNALGSLAFPRGGSLQPPTTGRSRVLSLSVVSLWRQALSQAGFRELRRRWAPYVEAGLVVPDPPGGSPERIGVRFVRGISGYDPTAITNIVVVGPDGRKEVRLVPNTYAYLTDTAVQVRWQALYGGRQLLLQHRTAAVKVEAHRVTQEEFQRVWMYLHVYFESLLRGPDRLRHGLLEPKDRLANPQMQLKALQEADPELYDVRRHDPEARVYSVLCQHPRPPVYYSEKEARKLPAAQRKGLVEYWNFTEQQPAYYACPSKRFPHLSFLEGRHPLGYCLPCCQKTPPVADSRRSEVNRICQKKHHFDPYQDLPEETTETPGTRHVLSYGKHVPPGRYSRISSEMEQGLLFGTLGGRRQYLLAGVIQTLPGVARAGYFFALAAALGLSQEAFAESLVRQAGSAERPYGTLGEGQAWALPSAAALQDILTRAFVQASPDFTAFSVGGELEHQWPDIVDDLARLAHRVQIIRLQDRLGNGDIAVDVGPESAQSMLAGHSQVRYVIVYELGGARPGIYPMVVDSRSNAVYKGDDEVIRILTDLLRSGQGRAPGKKEWDMDLLRSALPVARRLVNMHNQCYGAVLQDQTYIPLRWQPFTADGLPLQYGPRPAALPTRAQLLKYLEKLNGHRGYRDVEPAQDLVDPQGQQVGFRGSDGLHYYHQPEKRATKSDRPSDGRRLERATILLPVDPRQVDQSIYSGRPPKYLPEEKDQLANEALYRNNRYGIFVSLFARLLQEERNEELRGELDRALKKGTLRTELRRLVEDHGDRSALRLLLLEAQEHKNPQKYFQEQMRETTFLFDHLSLKRLQLVKRAARPAAIRAMLQPHVLLSRGATDGQTEGDSSHGATDGQTEGDSSRGATDGQPEGDSSRGATEEFNIYSACASDAEYCGGPAHDKLKLTQEEFETMSDILASDVGNPLVAPTLPGRTVGVLNETLFFRQPGVKFVTPV